MNGLTGLFLKSQDDDDVIIKSKLIFESESGSKKDKIKIYKNQGNHQKETKLPLLVL